MIISRSNLQRLLATTAFVAAASAASAQAVITTNSTSQIITSNSLGTFISGTANISVPTSPAIVISGTGQQPSGTLGVSAGAVVSSTAGVNGTISLSTWNGLLGGVVVNNSGTIINDSAGGVAINLTGGAGAVSGTIRNTGTISGTVTTGANQLTYESEGGTLTGGISTTQATATDSVTLTNGTVTGNVSLGAGANNLTISGTSGLLTGNYTGTTGNDTLSVTNGRIIGDVDVGAGTNAITISGTTARVNGNITGGAAGDTLTLTNGTISGTVALGAGTNTVSLTNATLTTGATNAFNDTAGGDDSVFLVNSTVSGTMAFGTGTDNLYISGSSPFTTSGAITGLENLGISNTTNVRNTISGLATVGVASGARLNTSESLVLTGALTNLGTIEVAAGKNVSFTAAGSNLANGAFIFGLTSSTVGTISATSGALTLTNTSVTIKTDATTGFIASGTTRLLIDTGGATTLTSAALTNSQTAVYRFSLAASGANDINLVIGRIATSDLLTDSTGKAVANALDAIGNSSNAELSTLQNLIGNQTTSAGVANIVDSLAPAVDAGLGNAAIGVNVASANQVSNRLASLRDGTALSGLNTGDGTYTRNIWVEGFGGTTKQDDKDGAKGYDANNYGMSFGVDTDELVQDATVGAAFTYAMGTVDSNASSNASTDINTYIGTLYGSKTYDNGLFANAQASVGAGAYESERTVVGVGKAKGEFDGLQASLKGEVGKDFAMDALTLTPMAGLQYNYLDLDKYTETGAGGANLTVKSKSMSTVDASVGGKATYTLPLDNGGTLKPNVHANYVYRMGDDTLATTSNFTGGGASFATTGVKSDRSSVNLGTGLLLTTASGVDLSAEYNADLRSSLTGHTGQLKARWAF